MIRLTLSYCVLLWLAGLQVVLAASRLGPPVEQLLAHPERIRIVIAQAQEQPQEQAVCCKGMFSVQQRLSGESPDELLLRTDAATFADLVPGRSYVVAWSYLRRNRREIGGWEVDPDGPATVEVLGLGSTALFEDTPQIRLLFSPAANTAPTEQLDALLTQMQRQDFRSRGLVITELYLRPDLAGSMTVARGEVLQAVLQDQALDPQHQDFLLQTALRLPQDMTSPWLGEACRRIIIQHGTQYDLSSFVPGLVRTAATGLQQTGVRTDLELLGILLYSNNPGVAKAALAAMDHLDAAATAHKVQQALARDWLHSETRRALQRYFEQSGLQSAKPPADSA